MKTGHWNYWQASCHVGSSVQIPAHMRERVLEVSKLYVPPEHRRLRYADGLMTVLCAEADKSEKVLLVHCQPFGDSIEPDALKGFYERHGFQQIQPEPLLMARPIGGTPGRVTLNG
jgi:hypothetical protein